MDVTHGQHKWWKGKEMRRHNGRFKRHNHQKNIKYSKSKLKSGCPVRVPAVPPACPEKLIARRGRRSPTKKGNGKFRKLDFSSSEEDGGWFAKSRKPKKSFQKPAPKKCVDAKTRKTSSYYPGGTFSTKTITYSTRYNFDKEDVDDDEDAKDEGDDFESTKTFTINTTPIIDTRNTDISASRTIYSETASTQSEIISSEWNIVSSIQSSSVSLPSSQTFSSSSATVGLNELLGRRDSSSLVMNEQPPTVSTQWRSSNTDSAASMSTAESIAPTSTWKNSVPSQLPSAGSLDDIMKGNKAKSLIAPSLPSQWTGGRSSLVVDSQGPLYPGLFPDLVGKSILPNTKTTPPYDDKQKTQNRDVVGTNLFTDQTFSPTSVLSEIKTTTALTTTTPATPTTTTPPTPTTTQTTTTPSTTTPITTTSRTSTTTTSETTTSLSTRQRWEPILNDKKYSSENSGQPQSTDSTLLTRTWKNEVSPELPPSVGSLDDILGNNAGAKSSSASTTVGSSSSVDEGGKVLSLDDLLRSKNSNDNSNKDKGGSSNDDASKMTMPPFLAAVTVPEQKKALPDIKTPPPINIPKFEDRILYTNAANTFPTVQYTLNADLFTKKSTEQAIIPQNPIVNIPKFDEKNIFINTRMTPPEFIVQTLNADLFTKKSTEQAIIPQNPIQVPKFDERNIFVNTRMTPPEFVVQTINPDFFTKKAITEQTDSPTKSVPQIDEKLLWAHTKTTSANIDTMTPNQISSEIQSTLTAETTFSTESSTRTHRRGGASDNNKKETPQNVADTSPQATQTTNTNLNDLLKTTQLEQQTTTKNAIMTDTSLESSKAKSAESTIGTTKISLLDLVPAGVDKSASTINPLNQFYTTKNSLTDQSPGAKFSSEENSQKNDKRAEESGKSSTIKEVVTENGRSSATNRYPLSSQRPLINNNAKSEASSGTDSSQRPTASAPNLIDLIATSGPAVDNKKGEAADEKNKSPLNDLLLRNSSETEITFSVTSSNTKYQPLPPNNNFHKESADATPPPAKTINPDGSVNNREQRGNEKTPASDKGGGSLNDLVSTQKVIAEATRPPAADPAGAKPMSPEAKEEDDHRKYVFYLMFGTSNCNCGTSPNVTVNRISASSNTTGDIKWVGGADSAGSLSDGDGGTFFIGYRKGPGKGAEEKAVQPMFEIKMEKEERACNSIYSSFFK